MISLDQIRRAAFDDRSSWGAAVSSLKVLKNALVDLFQGIGPGVFVTVTVGTSATSVTHTLGKEVTGWIIVGKSGAGDVWATSLSPLTMQASTAVTVKLFVF